MSDHVITVEWISAPDGVLDSYACSCGLPLDDRDIATRHAEESGQCTTCLGSGTVDADGCGTCDGSGQAGSGTFRATVTEEFVQDVAALLPAEFGLNDVVRLVGERLLETSGQGGIQAVVSVSAGLVRYLEVCGQIVLCTAPDYVPGEGVQQTYGDPRWIRLPE
ncbi:hypothetical protein [Nonomuraea zeae]|uniref:Uncharacterized protein n=1 Tax=Nonomuraea zeae TaxID=1642303 RepID=A0A5S4GRF1_9ACTN|nr:hypothetical protein [Nonomuraea zeae]TMR35493.1 hypothetical protein ETD85_13815 [Nonomuraea zeae]